MQFRSGSQIREDFLRFFETKAHRRVHSSSLVPVNDPTLLFTNAGMNQFKDVFLGAEQREYTRATTSQKCVRAGGKHNDLENVGFTRRHHTFFEMLGNFSFGDYFKKDAIAFAWELLTSPDWYGIPQEKLYVTIFEGDAAVPRDAEAYQFWLDVGVPAERIFELSAKDNFWAMGDTGPCGPCSEIYFDLGVAASEHNADLPFGEDEQRYVEIWNLVFMQFDRSSDGVLTPLPKPSIDTGMGLERIACVLQGKLSNYETDLFTPLIARAAELTRKPMSADEVAASAVSDERAAASLRIISDHARAATFLINDGVLPANEGRGYVLRKIMRRGIRHGRLLGQEQPFLHEMVLAVRDEMGVAYPELIENAERIAKVVLAEEQQFARILGTGAERLERYFYEARLSNDQVLNNENILKAYVNTFEEPNTRSSYFSTLSNYVSYLDDKGISLREATDELTEGFILDRPDALKDTSAVVYRSQIRGLVNFSKTAPTMQSHFLHGREAFRYYETFGLPQDFIEDAARDAGFEFDYEGFERAKQEEQARARASWKGGSQKTTNPILRELPKTSFAGYTEVFEAGCEILAILRDGVSVSTLSPDVAGEIILDKTPFYGESGGQVGDTGWLYAAGKDYTVATVESCIKPVQGLFVHRVVASAELNIGDRVDAMVNTNLRDAIERNHTGTHLLHAALRTVLGTHVHQAGSLVSPDRLRFDFAHGAPISDKELWEIEDFVNGAILDDEKVEIHEDVPIDVAINELHAMALFGEKYGDLVRVVKIGDTSIELCGGTHLKNTAKIGPIKFVSEGGVSSGVRRIEAVTGFGALESFRQDSGVAETARRFVGTTSADTNPAEALAQKISSQEEELKKLRRELDEARMKSAASSMENAADSAVTVKGIKVLAQRVDGLDKNQMRALVDTLRGKLGEGVVILGASLDGKATLIVGVTKELTSKVQAGKIVSALAAKVGGKGGGRPDLAEAGGNDPGALDGALASAADVVSALLA